MKSFPCCASVWIVVILKGNEALLRCKVLPRGSSISSGGSDTACDSTYTNNIELQHNYKITHKSTSIKAIVVPQSVLVCAPEPLWGIVYIYYFPIRAPAYAKLSHWRQQWIWRSCDTCAHLEMQDNTGLVAHSRCNH